MFTICNPSCCALIWQFFWHFLQDKGWAAAPAVVLALTDWLRRQEPVNETLPILNQLREQQLAEQPQLQLTYQQEEATLQSNQEQQLHQFLAYKDPDKIALISGPGPQTDMLASARLASQRLTTLTRLLGSRAIELEPRYDPMLAPNTLLIRILPRGEQATVTPSAAQ